MDPVESDQNLVDPAESDPVESDEIVIDPEANRVFVGQDTFVEYLPKIAYEKKYWPLNLQLKDQ